MPKEGTPLYRREVAALSGAGSYGSLTSWDPAGRHTLAVVGRAPSGLSSCAYCVMLGWQF